MSKYKIIYADPAWQYGSRGPRGGKFGDVPYSTTGIDGMSMIDVASIADDNAVCFMWFTASFSSEANELMRSWGFKPVRIDRVWKKIKPSGKMHAAVGPWGMSDAEFILIGVRGSGICSEQLVTNTRTVLEAAYEGKHSKKPDQFRSDIAARFPAHWPKLEMFAREAPDGWDVFGNEAPNGIDIPTRRPLDYAEELYKRADKLRKKAQKIEMQHLNK